MKKITTKKSPQSNSPGKNHQKQFTTELITGNRRKKTTSKTLQSVIYCK
jgi:hypothetical protein